MRHYKSLYVLENSKCYLWVLIGPYAPLSALQDSYKSFLIFIKSNGSL